MVLPSHGRPFRSGPEIVKPTTLPPTSPSFSDLAFTPFPSRASTMLPRLPLRSQLPRRLSRALPRNLSRVVSRHLSTLIAGGAVFGGATLAFASQWPQGSEAEAEAASASASASGFEPARRPPGKNDRSRFEGAASGAGVGAPSRSNPAAATNANANANASAEDAEGGEDDGEGTDNMNNNSAAAGRGGGSSFFNRMTGGYMDGAARTAASTARTAASTARSAAAKLVGRGGGGGGAQEEGGQHAAVGSERLLGALSRTSEGVTTDGEKPLSPADQAKAVDPRLGER